MRHTRTTYEPPSCTRHGKNEKGMPSTTMPCHYVALSFGTGVVVWCLSTDECPTDGRHRRGKQPLHSSCPPPPNPTTYPALQVSCSINSTFDPTQTRTKWHQDCTRELISPTPSPSLPPPPKHTVQQTKPTKQAQPAPPAPPPHHPPQSLITLTPPPWPWIMRTGLRRRRHYCRY